MTPDQILLLTLPQASQLSPEVRAQYIALVTPRVGTQLGDLTNQGIAYLAANEIVLSGQLEGVQPWPISSEKEGQLARTFSVTQIADAGIYGQTMWGMLYYALKQQRVITFGTYLKHNRFRGC